ncbi:uncharacterized protein B0H18DRAFT_997556 [Fomitopsis serialis]|uniref:uncharacterized protein n=1 Tax=Fomitopsis serialis TaxID=139415 RepID=UPI0020073CAA|nr:uncharacterized protein B0H18DRAFT_997556 [Neoantrodia serialis]KAH9929462.1 hypothetical protein B0H18DRAFT_997556 [Neoantrodia serialis]
MPYAQLSGTIFKENGPKRLSALPRRTRNRGTQPMPADKSGDIDFGRMTYHLTARH